MKLHPPETEPGDLAEIGRKLAADLGANGVDRAMAARFQERLRDLDPIGCEREALLAGALSHYMSAAARAVARRDDRAARRALVLAVLYDAAYDELAAESMAGEP